MHERGLSFKEAVNEAIRAGLGSVEPGERAFTTPRHLGAPAADITRALSLAGGLEDEVLSRRLAEGR